MSVARILCLAITLFFITSLQGVSAGDEYRPVAIWTAAESEQNFAIEKMFDGDPGTYASLLDETRTGKNPKTVPPLGGSPATIRFVLDLGKSQSIQGIRLMAQKSWAPLMARKVSIFTCDDAQGKTNLKPLVENKELPPVITSHSAFLTWQRIKTRYIAVSVLQSWEEARNLEWWQNAFNKLLKRFNKDVELSGLGQRFLVNIAEVTCFDDYPKDITLPNKPEIAAPESRIQRDWLYQDCGLDITRCFLSKTDAKLEKRMITKVIAEIAEEDPATSQSLTSRLKKLVETKVPGFDPQWKKLYFDTCQKRRALRLQALLEETNQIVYVKHYIYGGWTITEQTEYETDAQYTEITPEWQPGAQLCLATVHPDGSVTNELLISQPEGGVRDPCLAPDGQTLYFSMRTNYKTDNYHLYRMDLKSRKLEQITFEPVVNGRKIPCTDTEPCITAEGKIIFQSTRCAQIDICKPHTCSNLYTSDSDGKNIMRLGFDQLHTFYPQVLEDGRVTYTRWEYNDRNPLYIQPLIMMNSDGTSQTEYYGNNSMYPVAVIHARGIPGTSKIMAIISGHHVLQKGALAVIDRNNGTQGNGGIEFLRHESPLENSRREHSQVDNVDASDTLFDFFGHYGPQYQYPYPFDEDRYLVAHNPEGYFLLKGPATPPMGVYFMTSDGARELLAFDWLISSGQPIPVKKSGPSHSKKSPVKLNENFGSCFVQDIYEGPGLKGIERGTIKKLRVVALEYRAALMGDGMNSGEAGTGTCHTPISFNSGSWDVKHVLGEVDIEEDGSAYFTVPARAPVYFQLLDQKGQCVQTMRSWATLMPGEQFGCIGCHENKNDAAKMIGARPTTIAMKKAPQKLKPSFGITHPLMAQLEKENALDSLDLFLGVNAIRSLDPDAPTVGFSYRQRVQPILDRHCVKCHIGDPKNSDPEKRSTLALTGEVVDVSKTTLGGKYYNHLRNYTRSYTALTDNGSAKGSKWLTWYNPRARAAMLPPKFCGSTVSSLMDYLEPKHYGVRLTENEKQTIACWIDLAVPFCGSYTEANRWSDKQRTEYQYFQNKRVIFAQEELDSIRRLLNLPPLNFPKSNPQRN